MRDYRKHQHWSQPIDQEVMRTYKAVAQGKVVIRALDMGRVTLPDQVRGVILAADNDTKDAARRGLQRVIHQHLAAGRSVHVARMTTNELPPYVIQGEHDWRPETERWMGPLSHPYGHGAYCVVEPGGVPPRVRIYPSKAAATPYLQECGFDA